MATRDELLAQAAALDAEAIAAHSDDRPQAALRRQAAELRVQALGPKPYPVLICSSCFRLTGWLGADGVCAPEPAPSQARERRLARQRAARPLPAESGPLLRRMRRTLGVGQPPRTARGRGSRVEPGETGPVAPEEGWELEVPVKYEQEAPEGHDLLVYFDVASVRFEYGAWRPVDGSHSGKPYRLGPREFAASLSGRGARRGVDRLRAGGRRHNRRVWHAEADTAGRPCRRAQGAARSRGAPARDERPARLAGVYALCTFTAVP